MYLKESCKGVDLGKNGVSLGHQGLTQEGFSLDRSFIGTQRKVNEVQVVTRRQENASGESNLLVGQLAHASQMIISQCSITVFGVSLIHCSSPIH